jgi:hypothetical protein
MNRKIISFLGRLKTVKISCLARSIVNGRRNTETNDDLREDIDNNNNNNNNNKNNNITGR